MDDFILHINSVNKSFARNIINLRGEVEDERYRIIEDLDLLVPDGKITALIGGNGAGKTSLFNIISGFMKADSGEVLFRNDGSFASLLGLNPEKITLKGVGRMFQDSHIFPDMSVMDNMMIADSDNYGEAPFVSLIQFKRTKKFEIARAEKANKIFTDLLGNPNPLWEKRNELAGSLSYGQQRILGLTRLLMGDYKLVLLDEPTAGVNPETIKQIMNIIRFLVENKRMSVFLIEHNMKVVLELADFCSFMSHGKITAFGTPEDVIGNKEVRQTYLGL